MQTFNSISCFFGYEIWFLALREEYRLSVLESRVLKREAVTEDWRKLHDEELHNLFSSPIIIRMIELR
jgi:hypothetical protein